MAAASVTTISVVFLTLIVASHPFLTVAQALGELVTYWGQNAGESTLAEVCQTSLYDMVVVSYLDLSCYGLLQQYPYLNLDVHCNSTDGGCASLSTDIAICQSMNVRVLLSISSGNYTAFDGIRLPQEVPDIVASYLWNNFLSGEAADPSERPLGPAVLDGIDFGIESGSGNPGIMSYYGHLAQFIRQLSVGSAVLTASPGCSFPDPNLGPELSGSALESGTFDYVWVRFYDNSLCEFKVSHPNDVSAILGAWEQWTEALPKVQVLLGIPVSPVASVSGFIPSSTLVSDILPLLQGSNNYGGIMLHSFYYDSNSTYATSIKSVV